MTAIDVAGLGFAYPDGREVLRGVDLTVQPGERLAVLGRNGAGKTTLLLHLNGILSPTAGSVTVHGSVLGRDTVRDIRRRVGLVFQDPDDQLFMPTVGEDVAFGPSNYGVRGRALDARVDRALATVGLPDARERAPHHLSLGQRRRAAIATILAMDCDVVVLDEPTANLDPAARRELSTTLRALDATIVVVTHDLPYADELCERSVILDDGRIVADGPTGDLLSDPELLSQHGLELPHGFTPGRARPSAPTGAV